MELIFKVRFLFPSHVAREFFHSKSGKKFSKIFIRTCAPTPISSSVGERGHHLAQPRGQPQQPPVAKARVAIGILATGTRISEEVKGRT